MLTVWWITPAFTLPMTGVSRGLQPVRAAFAPHSARVTKLGCAGKLPAAGPRPLGSVAAGAAPSETACRDAPVVDADVVQLAANANVAAAHLDPIGTPGVHGVAVLGLDPVAPPVSGALRPVLERVQLPGDADEIEAAGSRDRRRAEEDRPVIGVVVVAAGNSRRARVEPDGLRQGLREVAAAGSVSLRGCRQGQRPRDEGERQEWLDAPGQQELSANVVLDPAPR